MKRHFFFFDIDNTLLAKTPEREWVPDSAKYAVQKLKEAGHFCAIATGRAHAMAEPYLEMFGFENMVHDGGNGLTLNGELQYIEPMDRSLSLELLHEAEKKGFAWAVSDTDSIVRIAPSDRFREVTVDHYMETRTVPGLEIDSLNDIYKIYIACFPGEEEQLETLKGLPWHRSHDEYIFVEPMDKSIGIRRVLQHFHGSPEDVVVFGDAVNDLSMFTDEWTCIAMGNAVQSIKDAATYVTDDDKNDGIYKACVHFGWIPEGPF